MPNIEQIIQEAMARGEFEHLPGEGKPLDLAAYFDTPEEVRVAHALLKGADFLPQEVELLKEIAALNERRGRANDSGERARLAKQVEEKRLHFNLLMERLKRAR